MIVTFLFATTLLTVAVNAQPSTCQPGECKNGGECNTTGEMSPGDTRPRYCNCPVDYVGKLCGMKLSCPMNTEGVTCSGRGTCRPPEKPMMKKRQTPLTGTCVCDAGFSGSACEQSATDSETPVCSQNCKNGGTCIAGDKCSCPAGFTGDRCGKTTTMMMMTMSGSECPASCNNRGACLTPMKPADSMPGTDSTMMAMMMTMMRKRQEMTPPPTCFCEAGWSGSDCGTQDSTHAPVCADSCKNGGTCVGRMPGGVPSMMMMMEPGQMMMTEPGQMMTDPMMMAQPDKMMVRKRQPSMTTTMESAASGQCACPEGFSGAACGKKSDTFDGTMMMMMMMTSDDCFCKNGGKCVPLSNQMGTAMTSENYQCACPTGYQGTDCSKMCDQSTCSGHGDCKKPGRKRQEVSLTERLKPDICDCHEGYAGSFCEQVATPCTDASCQNGQCREQEIVRPSMNSDGMKSDGMKMMKRQKTSHVVCVCEAGWTGLNCDVKGDSSTPVRMTSCAATSCKGKCVGNFCLCPEGLAGAACDRKVEEPVCDDCSGADTRCLRDGSCATIKEHGACLRDQCSCVGNHSCGGGSVGVAGARLARSEMSRLLFEALFPAKTDVELVKALVIDAAGVTEDDDYKIVVGSDKETGFIRAIVLSQDDSKVLAKKFSLAALTLRENEQALAAVGEEQVLNTVTDTNNSSSASTQLQWVAVVMSLALFL